MIFWMLICLIAAVIGTRVYNVAAEDLFNNRQGQEAFGAVVAALGILGFVVNLLRFAWVYLP